MSEISKKTQKKWSDWLEFDTLFAKPGKQGIVGLFRKKGDREKKYIFKMSQNMDHLIQHEYTVMESLSDITKYCPHFCKSIGIIKCDVDANYRKAKNPFEIQSKYSIQKDVMICEYIDNSSKLYNYIRSDKISEDILYSTVKQVLMALIIAQRDKKFTHYDLHANNIMMKKCNSDIVFLYVLDDENQFCIPTHGRYPIIIDYGFSYSSDLVDTPLCVTLSHTEVGFMSDRFDWVADPKLFLITVSDEIKSRRNSKRSRRFRRIVRNLFFPLKIDWETGWDTGGDKGASDYIHDKIEKICENEKSDGSDIFRDYGFSCVDILQSLVILPLQKQDSREFDTLFKSWMKEWRKIEDEIGSPFYNLYVLKMVVDAARAQRPNYMCKETRGDSVKRFRNLVYTSIDKVSKFCRPKGIHFERMLVSLILLSRSMEGILYDSVEDRMADKEKQYSKLPYKSSEQIYGGIEANIPDKYVYNENTVIYIMDSMKKETVPFTIPEDQLENVNNTHPLARGTFIYDMYNNS